MSPNRAAHALSRQNITPWRFPTHRHRSFPPSLVYAIMPPTQPPNYRSHSQRNPSVTKGQFLDGARDRLVAVGWSGLTLSIFSMLGPCLLAVALSNKIRQVEGMEEGTRRNSDGKKRSRQLRRWFQETNALLTAFACVCTG